MNTIERQEKILLITFLFIPSILLLLFVVYPIMKLLHISFTNWNGIDATMKYVGFNNYKRVIFDSPELWLSLKNNGLYFFIHLLAIPVEIFIAFLLDRKLRGAKFFKTMVFMPYIINGVAVSYMFSMLYSSEGGALNYILNSFNMEPVNWLSNSAIVNFSLVAVSIWRFSGMHIILFLAGIQSISHDMIEAAIVDGANVVQQFFKIILPNIKTVVTIVLFLNVSGALQVFDIPFIMTQGGPGSTSSTFTLFTIETAFKYSNFGKACAMAVILMILIILISGIQNKLLGEKEQNYGR
ncbi:MAG: sugar ABC transporter permease [Anaeromicrobium sp.]|jgi:multiple sugar transport system permease protein|nr:sugar ABC transporter permease [Anaeromicrobium sp.]MCT4594457.1 sugar ABC transporter permease [Anaeromicrobium sp.]